MKWIFGLLLALVLAGGAWHYMGAQMPPQAGADAAGTVLAGSGDQVGPADQPTGAAGINGGTNQGNMGQPANGQVQMPMADGAEGSIIGSNLALGVDATGKPHLIGYNGMTLYTYTKDTGTGSACYDDCAGFWPPYLVGAEDNVHQVKAGVGGTVDTIIRKDGGIQVTYNGHPLYFYARDTKASDMGGDAKGGMWYVVKP